MPIWLTANKICKGTGGHLGRVETEFLPSVWLLLTPRPHPHKLSNQVAFPEQPVPRPPSSPGFSQGWTKSTNATQYGGLRRCLAHSGQENEELLLVMKIWELLLSGLFCLYSEALQRGLRSEGALFRVRLLFRGPLLPNSQILALCQGSWDLGLGIKIILGS